MTDIFLRLLCWIEGVFLSRRLALLALNGALVAEIGLQREKSWEDMQWVPLPKARNGKLWSFLRPLQIDAIQGVFRTVNCSVITLLLLLAKAEGWVLRLHFSSGVFFRGKYYTFSANDNDNRYLFLSLLTVYGFFAEIYHLPSRPTCEVSTVLSLFL